MSRNEVKTKKLLVYIYMRYSSEMQNYMSIKAQRRAIIEFCKQNHYVIVQEYVDEAKSATTVNRPQFQQMIRDAVKNKIDAIVVHKLDRFSRNKTDFLVCKTLLQKKNIQLISVTEKIDDTPEGKLLEGLISLISEFYVDNLGREVQKGKKEAAHDCVYLGGYAPLGYDVNEDKKFVVNPKESTAVKYIFDMYINDYSYQQIADFLNKKGYTTKKGLKFNKNSFISIIENAEAYTGMYMYNKAQSKRIDGSRNSHKRKADSEIIKVAGGLPRIISDDVYERVVKKRLSNKELAGAYHSRRYYLLNGMVKCGECGRSYSGNTSFAGRNKTEYATYRCGNYRNNCPNKDVNTKYLNDFVLTQLIEIIFKKENYAYMLKRLNQKLSDNIKNTNEIISLKNELVQKEAALKKLSQLLLEDCTETVLETIKTTETEKNNLLMKIENYSNMDYIPFTDEDIDEVKEKFKAFLLKQDLLICRKFIRSFIKEVIVYKDRVEITLKTEKE